MSRCPTERLRDLSPRLTAAELDAEARVSDDVVLRVIDELLSRPVDVAPSRPSSSLPPPFRGV